MSVFTFAGKDSISFHQLQSINKTNGESYIKLAINVAPFHKAYVDKFLIKTDSKNLKNLFLSPITEIMDPHSPQLKKIIEGNAILEFYVNTPRSSKLNVEIHYQLCSIRECFFKSSQKVNISVK